MSIAPVSAAACPSASPAAPAQPPGPQTLLPFMLLLPPDASELPAMPPPETAFAEAEVSVDEAEQPAPLIGWLFDSIALASDTASSSSATPGSEVARATRPGTERWQTPQWPTGAVDAPAPAPASAPAAASIESASPAVPVAPTAAQAAEMVAEPPPPALVLPAAPAWSTVQAAVMTAPASNVAPLQPPVYVQADGADLGAELGERISWQLQQGIGEATIELHPAELGALTIRIETQGQQAQVHILAAETAARALLSQCLPQLRELLGASGLTLTKGQVESAERRGAAGPAGDDGLSTPRGRRRVTSVTLIDAYV